MYCTVLFGVLPSMKICTQQNTNNFVCFGKRYRLGRHPWMNLDATEKRFRSPMDVYRTKWWTDICCPRYVCGTEELLNVLPVFHTVSPTISSENITFSFSFVVWTLRPYASKRHFKRLDATWTHLPYPTYHLLEYLRTCMDGGMSTLVNRGWDMSGAMAQTQWTGKRDGKTTRISNSCD